MQTGLQMMRITRAIKLTVLGLAGLFCLIPHCGARAQVDPFAGMPPMAVQTVLESLTPDARAALFTAMPQRPQIQVYENPYVYARNNPYKYVDPSGLSSILYDRSSGTITIYDSQGNQVGQYAAGNNTTSSSNGPWPNGTYPYSYYAPHPESASNGSYGSNGNFVFNVPGRTGMGVHAGRSGPQSKTLGCIRTTNDATLFLKTLNSSDPLQSITVQ